MFRIDELIEDLFRDNPIDIKDDSPEAARRTYAVRDPRGDLVEWDYAPYGHIIDEFTEDHIDYVIVQFQHPDNPPSNQKQYLYLAPEEENGTD